MKSDIEIAREAKLKPIQEIAQSLNIPEKDFLPYGHYMGKISLDVLKEKQHGAGHLILVTAITPTKAGIGKTTVSIGLALGMNQIGKKAIVALREPSLGPVFGVKGGAAGGGYSQVLPMDKINLHFTGDFHAITSANNTISALVDNYAYRHRNDEDVLSKITWRRVLDVNDRSIRHIVTGLGDGNGEVNETGFDITPASEIMAILCLAKDIEDLRRRIDNIVVGYKKDGSPFTVGDMKIGGAITVLLMDALQPNLVQTTENTPAFIHGGPFANIAHGCNSVIATKMAIHYGDYAITEAGFGADLGAEKFLDIVCRQNGLQPAATILVATAKSLKLHGGVKDADLSTENVEALKKGFTNLDQHVENMRKFGQSVIICINRFPTDTEAELEAIRLHCEELGVPFAVNNAFAEGGKGATELAQVVVDTIDKHPSKPLTFGYDLDSPVKEKIEALTREIYRADRVVYDKKAIKALKMIDELGYDKFPICIAKTQYSFSDDASLLGAPRDFEMHVNDIVVTTGAEMIVVIMGSIMRMPGLPKVPNAEKIDIVNGEIDGLS